VAASWTRVFCGGHSPRQAATRPGRPALAHRSLDPPGSGSRWRRTSRRDHANQAQGMATLKTLEGFIEISFSTRRRAVPADMKPAIACVELCRGIANSAPTSSVDQVRGDAVQPEGRRTRKLHPGCRRALLASFTCSAIRCSIVAGIRSSGSIEREQANGSRSCAVRGRGACAAMPAAI
jgi:hypothetical protein